MNDTYGQGSSKENSRTANKIHDAVLKNEMLVSDQIELPVLERNWQINATVS